MDKKDTIKREIYSVLLDNEITKDELFNKHEVSNLLKLHMDKNIKSWNDILILYTFKKFLRSFELY